MRFLLHPDLNSVEMMVADHLVRVEPDGYDTDDPVEIAALDEYPGVYRDGQPIPASMLAQPAADDSGKGKAKGKGGAAPNTVEGTATPATAVAEGEG
jgi:hypothetical protein